MALRGQNISDTDEGCAIYVHIRPLLVVIY